MTIARNNSRARIDAVPIGRLPIRRTRRRIDRESPSHDTSVNEPSPIQSLAIEDGLPRVPRHIARERKQVEENIKSMPVIHDLEIVDEDLERTIPKRYNETGHDFYLMGLEARKKISAIRKKKVLHYLVLTGGLIGRACRLARVGVSSHKRWRVEDPEYEAAFLDIRYELVNSVEVELMKKIKAGDTASIIFYLKTQGKELGYDESRGGVNVHSQTNIGIANTPVPADILANPTTEEKKTVNEIVKERTGISADTGMQALQIMSEYAPGKAEEMMKRILQRTEQAKAERKIKKQIESPTRDDEDSIDI